MSKHDRSAPERLSRDPRPSPSLDDLEIEASKRGKTEVSLCDSDAAKRRDIE